MTIHFPVADIDLFILTPVIVAFSISFVTSMTGATGAFLLLPFQVSVLGFTSPAVTATNHLYNVFGGPGPVIRYAINKQMLYPLTLTILAGTLPGIIGGVLIRIHLLPDPQHFKYFVAFVLLIIGGQLLYKTLKLKNHLNSTLPGKTKLDIQTVEFTVSSLSFTCQNELYKVKVPLVVGWTFVIGLIGGAYGIGGGSLNAAFFAGVLGLPMYAVAGPVILATWTSSLTAVIAFWLISPPGINTAPDVLLSFLFGVGGFIGGYFGARFQKYVPVKWLRLMLSAFLLIIAVRYLIN